MTRKRRNPLKVTYSARGRKVIVPVTVDAGGIHVEPVVEIPRMAANVEIVWTLRTRGWKFTDRGIRIEPGDGSARLAHLLVRRDQHLIGLLRQPAAESRIKAEMERDYKKFVDSGHGQFHSPRNEGIRFIWKDYNDYRELYEYSIEVTNGTTTMNLDPAIKNQGC